MAFPVVQTTSNGATSSTTSHSITMPAGITAGDKLVVFFATDGGASGNTDTPSGWTKQDETINSTGGAVNRLVTYTKTAAGSDTLTVTTDGSVTAGHIAYRIHTDGGFDVAAGADGNSTAPDSPSLTPAGGSESYLWVSAITHQSGTVSAFPTNYTDNQVTNTTAFNIAAATYSNTASSDNPSAYTTSSGRWVAVTVAMGEQSVVVGSAPILTGASTVLGATIDFAANASFALIESVSSIFAPIAKADNKPVWTSPDKITTTWTNLDKD